ncbi:hypothetical protein [Agromyces protaetiae]|uniref:hypothetical protein n=1 Tax=Agromyces protaetiae TaxID=2509455 RepID=UPI0013EB896B|nr:hypothetical protein [Agromyces protaetiae]
MSGSGFEYPDEAGYPDGMGTLDEGTGDADANTAARRQAAEADTAEVELEEFGLSDEEDVEGV